MKKNAVVAGGTGLIGSELLKILAERNDVHVVSLVRKAGNALPKGIVERVFSFENNADYEKIGTEIPCDIFFCCLGTTLKSAGSAEAFRRVDLHYPQLFLRVLQKNAPQSTFAFVSSLGADRPTGLYLKTKNEMENELSKSSLSTLIVRPSLLIGNRPQFRLGERIAAALAVPLFDLAFAVFKRPPQFLAKLAPIEAEQVAQALVHYSFNSTPQDHVVAEGRDLFEV